MRALAHRLVAASRAGGGAPASDAVLVAEKMRVSMIKFAGVEGFASLLRRALTLAKAEAPLLRCFHVTDTGTLEESNAGGTATPPGSETDRVKAAEAVTAHLLGLLETFVGEPLTLMLVRDAWPEVAPHDRAGSEDDR